jgi:hypothetical protein
MLVDEISRSNGIVYIELGICAFGHLDGCLLPFLVSSNGDRYLRVVVTRGKKRTHDQLLALIAHEMRHVLEVLEHEEVVDVETLESMYRKIGVPHLGGSHGYETSAARAAGDAVFDELVTPTYRIALSGREGLIVRLALEGAGRRLASPECQKLFTDFRDPAGHALSDTIAAWGKTPRQALATLGFVDGDESLRCRDNGMTDAITKPGSRVIYVCGKRFADRLERNLREMILIHELLHALGLGENPPASADITRMVLSRCGN